MIYHWSLQFVALVAGLVLIAFALPGLFAPAAMSLSVARFPRSRAAGIVLLSIDFLWSFWLLATMEMGEFSGFRRPLLIVLPIAFLLVLRFADEFLSVRALGIFLLLAAEPLLDAAFFRYEESRLFVTVFAYLLIVAGLIWVMMPYLLRDKINWNAKSTGRWRLLTGLMFVYGAMLIGLAITRY